MNGFFGQNHQAVAIVYLVYVCKKHEWKKKCYSIHSKYFEDNFKLFYIFLTLQFAGTLSFKSI